MLDTKNIRKLYLNEYPMKKIADNLGCSVYMVWKNVSDIARPRNYRTRFGRGFKGKPCSEENKKKASIRMKGKKMSKESRKKLSESRIGMKFTDEHKLNISKGHKGLLCGENHPNWKGGITNKRTKYRNCPEYKEWRTRVFKRDEYICTMCGETKEYLHAHHLIPFSDKMDNYDINNGKTVCYKCHEYIHGFALGKGSKKNKR